ncbi:hypothetical protein RQP46_005639 [Phenoliferia psychrophenolica]
MSTQPAKRLRRSARLAGPATELPACPIVDLPLELMEAIISNLDCDDLYSLASTSKLFHTTYHLRAVLMKLEQYSLSDGAWDGELFCLSDAKSGEFGWSLFLMMLSDEPLEVDDAVQYLTVEAVSPTFERFRRSKPTSAYLFIQQTDSEVRLRAKYFDVHFSKDLIDTKYLDWDADLAGRLVRATPGLLEERFECPECEGTGEIILGTKNLRKRYVNLASPSL